VVTATRERAQRALEDDLIRQVIQKAAEHRPASDMHATADYTQA
jgi:hypothetical protein